MTILNSERRTLPNTGAANNRALPPTGPSGTNVLRRIRPLGLLLALLACLAVVAAACGGAESGADRTAVEIVEGDAVQIRAMLSYTGAPGLGESLYRAAQMAVEDFNGVHGYEVELGEPIDSKCSGDGGGEAAQRVASEPMVLGAIGTSCSGAAVAASPILSEAGLTMISPSNTSPSLTSNLQGAANSNYHTGYFRVSNNDLYQAQAVADFAYNELGLRKMAAVHDGDPYTSGLVAAFDAAFSARGGEVVAVGEIEKGQTDMTDLVLGFEAARPDGLFFPLFATEGLHFARQARLYVGLVDAKLIGGAALLVSDFLGAPESEDVYFSGPEADFGNNMNVSTGQTADVVLNDFIAAYGGPPTSPYWAHAYDATTLLLAAIQRAGTKDEGNPVSRAFGFKRKLQVERAALRDAIRQASADFHGLTGPLSCDEFGDCGSGRVNIYHHTDSNVTDTAQLPVVYSFAP